MAPDVIDSGASLLPADLSTMRADDPRAIPYRHAIHRAWFETTGYDSGRPPHDSQLALHDDDHRFRCLAKGRRGGGTTAAAREAEAEAMLWAGVGRGNIGLFAPTKELTSRLFDMIWNCLVVRGNAPAGAIVVPAELRATPPRERKIVFSWGAMIVAYSLDAEMPGEGLGFKLVIVDEAGHKNFNHATWWSSIYPALIDQGGRGLIVGAVKQDGQTFRELRRMESSQPDLWSTHRFPSIANPSNPPDEIARAKASMPDWLFRMEIEAEDVDIGTSPWTADEVDAIVDDALPLRSDPGQSKGPFVSGWDLAKSVDWTVGITLDIGGVCAACDGRGFRRQPGPLPNAPSAREPCPSCERGRVPFPVVDLERFQHRPWPQVDEAMAASQRRWDSTVIFDRTGVGAPMADYMTIPISRLWKKQGSSDVGFTFTPRSKNDLIINLQRMIQSRGIRIPRHPQLVRELLDYRWDDGEIPETDCVMALALSCWMASTRPMPRIR